jgi:hypothetical protein
VSRTGNKRLKDLAIDAQWPGAALICFYTFIEVEYTFSPVPDLSQYERATCCGRDAFFVFPGVGPEGKLSMISRWII